MPSRLPLTQASGNANPIPGRPVNSPVQTNPAVNPPYPGKQISTNTKTIFIN